MATDEQPAYTGLPPALLARLHSEGSATFALEPPLGDVAAVFQKQGLRFEVLPAAGDAAGWETVLVRVSLPRWQAPPAS